MTRVVWLACSCYVWPIVLGERVGTCGYCGERPVLPVPEPADGKAGPRP